jgi:competence protein ComEC
MKEFLEYQYKNHFLWVPFIMAFGAAWYFNLDMEPVFRFPILITILLCAIIFKYKNTFIRIIALFLFGFFYAMSFTHINNTIQIKDSFGFVPVSGVVQRADFTNDSTRVVLSISGNQLDSELPDKPINIRISFDKDTPNIGDTINGDLRIFHASSKYVPASFDYARWLYFNHISGTGIFKDYEIIRQNSSNINIREYIHNKTNSALTDALVLGYKNSIPEQESQIWKSIGIGHVWSISGFHMTLVSTWLFLLFYLIFRTIPYITKRMPAKYPALICAWFGLIFYLFLSGIGVATIRAFLMATLVSIAIILGRGVFSLRNGALAFLAIFLINPFSIMNAGFQLSFAAVFGLLWFFDNKDYIKRTTYKRILHISYISLMTAIIATIFTLPFVIAHFGYIPVYTLIGNVIVLPIFSFAIMPLVMIGTIFALFGNHALINTANSIYDYTLILAKHISDLPYANMHTPYMSNCVLLLCIIGFLFLIFIVKPESKNIFIRNINYILCIICLVFALGLYSTRSKPLFYSTTDNELVGFVVDGKLKFNKSRASKHYFAFNTWRDFNNEEHKDKNEKYKCNHGLCKYKTDKWNLVYMQTFTTAIDNLEKICQDKNIDFIVMPFSIDAQKCHAKILTHGLLIYKNGKIEQNVNLRPWHNQH